MSATRTLRQRLIAVLQQRPLTSAEKQPLLLNQYTKRQTAGVFLLLTRCNTTSGYGVLLSKRSSQVAQPGDLCCPGGAPEPRRDYSMSLALRVPPFSWQPGLRAAARRSRSYWCKIAFYLANALRESWEEIRLQPWQVEFLGALPPHRLSMFAKIIYPLVGLLRQPAKLQCHSSEVAALITLPLDALLDSHHYALYTLQVDEAVSQHHRTRSNWNFPCFIYQHGNHQEILWGATYRIVTSLLSFLYGFVPPKVECQGPYVKGRLDATYLTGRVSR